MRVPAGGASCLGVGRPRTGALPPPTSRLFGRAAKAHYPLAVGAGGAGVGTRHQPHSALSCAFSARHEGAPGGRLLPGCGASGVGRSPTPDHSSFQACGRGPLPTGCGCGGDGHGDPSPTPQRALLRAGFARCGGGTRTSGGGASCLAVGRPGTGTLPPATTRPFGCVVGARFPLALGAVCGRGGPAVLGTLSRAAVRRVLCALPGFAAPGGRCGLAPVLVSWLLPAACLSGVPHGPALVLRSSSGPVALLSPFGFPDAVVPFPTPGAVAPGFTGWLRGACGGRPRTGLIVPAAGPCRGKGAGRAPRCTCSGPRDGVVPGGSLRLRSWAACAAVVWRVWTRSLKRPVSRAVRLATRDSAGAPGLFRVDADTAPFGSKDATPRSRACVRVRALLGSVWRAGLSGAFWCASPFPWPFLLRSLLVRPPPSWACPVVVVGGVFFLFLFFSLPLPPPRCAPVVSRFACFLAPGALGLGGLSPPPLFFPFPLPPPLCAPLPPALRVFRPRVPWALAFCPPPLFLVPPPVVSGVSCFPVALGLCAPPPFFFLLLFFSFVSCFFFFRFFFPSFFCRLCGAGRVCVSLAVRCARVCLGSAVPVVALCALAGVVWCWLLGLAVLCCLLVGIGVVLRWCRPCLAAWLAALWFGVVCLGVPLPCVVFCCAVLSCGGVLSCSAVCLRRCLCLLFVSCRCVSAVCVLGCCAVCSLSSPPCAVPCCAVLVPFHCAVCVICAVSGGWCCWGSRCRCLLLGVCWWLWLPGVVVWWCVSALVPVSGLAVAQRLPCGVLLPCAVSCGAVLPCGAVLWCPVFFFCFSPCWWRWFPVVFHWFWASGRFWVVSVSVLCLCGAVLVCLRRCSLFGALLPSRGWLVFCVVACFLGMVVSRPKCSNKLSSVLGGWQ